MDTNTLTFADLLQLNPVALADPYPLYAQLRDYEPVHWESAANSWILTGFAEISAILRDARFSAARYPSEEQMEEWGMGEFSPTTRTMRNQLLFLDPPKHTRLRGLVSKAFTPKTIEVLRHRIQVIVDAAVDKALASGQMDIIADLAYPLPATVIAEMLGVPTSEMAQFKRWSSDFAVLLGSFVLSTEEMGRIQQSIIDFAAYFRGITIRLRQQPEDNLLSALAQAEEQGERLSEDELLANCILLLVAGHETTTNLIGNGTLALLRNPEQWQRLQEAPELIPGAIEELLRYDSPVQLTSRLPLVDVEVGDKSVKAGQETILLIGAANHDPRQFAAADGLDVGRPNPKHLSFGGGSHYCLGAPLARLEGQVVFTTLMRRLPNMQLASATAEWQPNVGLRGLKTLPVTIN